MDNVLATQHTSGPTKQAHAAMSESVALQWSAIFRGERPPRLINPEAWPAYVERGTPASWESRLASRRLD